MWAGFECTLNRVGERYQDQLLPSERAMRLECMRLLPRLGIKAFRYRIAWEDETTPLSQYEDDMAFFAENGITPILGLVHHGSGPAHTSLLDDNFADGLAQHAKKVAQAFPDAVHWTPVNEPLTTARFSALYGHWYPHERNEIAFWRALFNQIDGTIAAMREIRNVNPLAKLVQTEDLGTTFSTAASSDQAAYNNQRRWMTWDLLMGHVISGHPFYTRLCDMGFEERLRRISEAPCPPDIVGVNHYLTSDRFLDHRIARYPPYTVGSNGREAFADIEAVRVLSTPNDGMERVLSDAWDRYKIPVALTECHNACTREEQMRWVRDAWKVAEKLNAAGKNVVAVTIWTLMGARGWSSLLTDAEMDFEGGVFDPRSGTIRATGLADTITALTQGAELPPASNGAGWWQRDERLRFTPAPMPGRVFRQPDHKASASLLIAGITGSLGQAFVRAAQHRGLSFIATSRAQMALDDPQSIEAVLHKYRPWAVINATGWVRVDDAEQEAEQCHASNTAGALALAQACENMGIANVHFSSDLVFDGAHPAPYAEDAELRPLNVYGESKALADAALLAMTTPLVIRTAAFFSPFDRYNFAHHLVETLRQNRTFLASAEHQVSPTYVPHLANHVLDLAIDRAKGLWHVSNGDTLSWFDFAREISAACGLDKGQIDMATADELGWVAPRPKQSGLRTHHGQTLPPLTHSIAAFSAAVSR